MTPSAIRSAHARIRGHIRRTPVIERLLADRRRAAALAETRMSAA